MVQSLSSHREGRHVVNECDTTLVLVRRFTETASEALRVVLSFLDVLARGGSSRAPTHEFGIREERSIGRPSSMYVRFALCTAYLRVGWVNRSAELGGRRGSFSRRGILSR